MKADFRYHKDRSFLHLCISPRQWTVREKEKRKRLKPPYRRATHELTSTAPHHLPAACNADSVCGRRGKRTCLEVCSVLFLPLFLHTTDVSKFISMLLSVGHVLCMLIIQQHERKSATLHSWSCTYAVI